MSALVQQTEEWLEFRRNKIGASDAPVIMGISPWCTPYQLWAQKIGLREGPEKSLAMQRGIDLEDSARDCFEIKTGIFVLPQVVVHPQHEWMIASLDGMNIERSCIVEIKCAGKNDHDLAVDATMPPKYFPQIQHQLAVTGLDMSYYFSFDGNDGVVLEIYRDDDYIKKLIDKEKIFWDQLQNLEAPPLTEKDSIQRIDELWGAAAGDYLSAIAAHKQTEAHLKRCKEQLIFMSAGKNSRGGGVQVTHVARRGSIDYSAVPELLGVDLERYRQTPINYVKISNN